MPAEKTILQAWERVSQTQSMIGVVGPHLSGKTTLLKRLATGLDLRQVLYLDASRLISEEHIGLEAIRQLNIDPRPLIQSGVTLDWRTYLEFVFEALANRPLPTMILFDDLDLFLRRRNDLPSYLRHKLQTIPNVMLVATFSSGSENRLFAYEKPVYGLFRLAHLGRLTDSEVATTLTDQMGLPPSLAAPITTCLAGEPYLMSAFALTTHLLPEEDLNLAALPRVFMAIGTMLHPVITSLLREIPATASPLLWQMADPDQRWWKSARLARLMAATQGPVAGMLSQLQAQHMVEKHGSSYALRPLLDFGFWWTVEPGQPVSLDDHHLTQYLERQKSVPQKGKALAQT
jgi:hypothetical protein